ncbi:hypothetical protein HDF14_000870 [Edaphobacter lichenicola]|jgi:hypothetical protein|uniref:Uncharacterized protein n=1 Tax=Tunturiibacter gelidiferens TaxID=3069689 RepID=A0A9X0U2U5_9BACT|nr:hypothetical protein [Edaphobacter lichenicola]
MSNKRPNTFCADLSIAPSLFPCSQTADHTFAGWTQVTDCRMIHAQHVPRIPSSGQNERHDTT